MAMTFATSLASVTAFAMLFGVYYGSVYSLLTSLTISVVGLQRLAFAFGVEMISAGLGYLVAPPLAGRAYTVFTHTPLHWQVGLVQSLHTHPFTGRWGLYSLYTHTPSLAGGACTVFTHTHLHWQVGLVQSLHTHPFIGR